MDFFEQQHRARRRTWLMLLLFVLAVAAIVAVLNLVGVAVYIWIFDPPILYERNLLQAVPRHVYGWSTAVILGVIAWGTGRRLYQLSGGGVAVADMIGARGAAMMTGGRSEGGSENARARFDIRVFFIGLALWIIGSIGVFAGRLIKAVIAREREFLADASAVQFTRNPDGIGGALFKIGRRGSVIVERHAEELSHMCIGAPVNDYFEFPWLSTHPPLDARIERILGPGAQRLLS